MDPTYLFGNFEMSWKKQYHLFLFVLLTLEELVVGDGGDEGLDLEGGVIG